MKMNSTNTMICPVTFRNRFIAAILCVFAALIMFPLNAQTANVPREDVRNMNAEWRFSKAKGATFPLADAMKGMVKDGKQFYEPDYDDSDWQMVSVPHAVNADDSFDSLIADSGEQDLYRGFMFYRKEISLNGTDGKKLFLEFESVRQTVYLYVNGHFAGYYEAGVAPIGFDITPWVKPGENLIAVATDNTASRQMTSYVQETRPLRLLRLLLPEYERGHPLRRVHLCPAAATGVVECYELLVLLIGRSPVSEKHI